ncbi:MAG: ABC transporter ATP-binding protein [Armatimonadota bacterium]|nr:ABC transporter ATP-binding protein [Armatimonadota bacterium]
MNLRGAGYAAEVSGVCHRYGAAVVLSDVSLGVAAGEIHAVLGPNGAGKTTLLRILCGLLTPTTGAVRLMGRPVTEAPRAARRWVGFVPGGDRTFYLRLSGLENLIFFGRLWGMTVGEARTRALQRLAEVGLDGVAHLRVAAYSHGMQKKLAIARALLPNPPVLLIDEATHDLDPEASRTVRELVATAARQGAAVLWATQRVDEIRGFAHTVTLLHRGMVRFSGTVPQLLAQTVPDRYVLRVTNGRGGNHPSAAELQAALGRHGTIARAGGQDAGDYVLTMHNGAVLGDALAALSAARFHVLSCREERPGLEEAFLRLTGGARGSGSTMHEATDR